VELIPQLERGLEALPLILGGLLVGALAVGAWSVWLRGYLDGEPTRPVEQTEDAPKTDPN
jgi:hypothetical protein